MKHATILALAIAMTACTDAQMGKFKALGNSAAIKCYSGGELIYEGKSSGKVQSEANSDGYFFTGTDGVVREVSGNCVITYDP